MSLLRISLFAFLMFACDGSRVSAPVATDGGGRIEATDAASDASVCRPGEECPGVPGDRPPPGTLDESALGKACASEAACGSGEDCLDYSGVVPSVRGGHCVRSERACEIVTCPPDMSCSIQLTPGIQNVVCSR